MEVEIFIRRETPQRGPLVREPGAGQSSPCAPVDPPSRRSFSLVPRRRTGFMRAQRAASQTSSGSASAHDRGLGSFCSLRPGSFCSRVGRAEQRSSSRSSSLVTKLDPADRDAGHGLAGQPGHRRRPDRIQRRLPRPEAARRPTLPVGADRSRDLRLRPRLHGLVSPPACRTSAFPKDPPLSHASSRSTSVSSSRSARRSLGAREGGAPRGATDPCRPVLWPDSCCARPACSAPPRSVLQPRFPSDAPRRLGHGQEGREWPAASRSPHSCRLLPSREAGTPTVPSTRPGFAGEGHAARPRRRAHRRLIPSGSLGRAARSRRMVTGG